MVDETILVNTYACSMRSALGTIKIECTDKGLTNIAFYDEDFEEHSHSILNDASNQINDYLFGSRRSFDLPLDLKGTEFQKSAWSKLLEVHYGDTKSYAEQAQALGDPKSVRAVASANAANPVMIVVPCHRIIGSSGKLTGYAGGIARKRWLLQHEAKHSGFGGLFA